MTERISSGGERPTQAIMERYASYGKGAGRYEEKRRYRRKSVSWPATFIDVESSSACPLDGRLLNLSLGGLALSLSDVRLLDDGGNRENLFKTVFRIPGGESEVALLCTCSWSIQSDRSLRLGARFIDADFLHYQELQEYLVGWQERHIPHP